MRRSSVMQLPSPPSLTLEKTLTGSKTSATHERTSGYEPVEQGVAPTANPGASSRALAMKWCSSYRYHDLLQVILPSTRRASGQALV